MWLSRIEFDLVPLIKLLICIFLALKALDLAFPAFFQLKPRNLQKEPGTCGAREGTKDIRDGDGETEGEART